MDVALTVPDVHSSSGCLLDVGTEEHVGSEQDLGVIAVLAVDVLDDLHGVRGRAAVVGLGLHLRRGVDVHDHDRAGMRALPGSQLIGADGIRQRAAGVQVREQHVLVGTED